MTTNPPRQNQGDRETLLEIEDLLDRADRLEAEARLEAEERREAAGQPAKPKIGYAEFMARRAGISREEQERRMGLAPQAG